MSRLRLRHMFRLEKISQNKPLRRRQNRLIVQPQPGRQRHIFGLDHLDEFAVFMVALFGGIQIVHFWLHSIVDSQPKDYFHKQFWLHLIFYFQPKDCFLHQFWLSSIS